MINNLYKINKNQNIKTKQMQQKKKIEILIRMYIT